jgi:hypothetical protein
MIIVPSPLRSISPTSIANVHSWERIQSKRLHCSVTLLSEYAETKKISPSIKQASNLQYTLTFSAKVFYHFFQRTQTTSDGSYSNCISQFKLQLLSITTNYFDANGQNTASGCSDVIQNCQILEQISYDIGIYGCRTSLHCFTVKGGH